MKPQTKRIFEFVYGRDGGLPSPADVAHAVASEPDRVEMARVGWTPGQSTIAAAENHGRNTGRRRAALRQAIWDASRSMGTDEIADFVVGVLCEIDTDAP